MSAALRSLLVATVMGCGFSPELGAAAPATAAAVTAAMQPVFYAVEVNGARVSPGALLLMTPARELYARVEDLRSWRLNVPAGGAHVMRGNARYVALNALPGVTAGVDAATQTLRLQAGPSALRATDIRLGGLTRPDVARPAGAYANYAFANSGGSYGNAFAGELETGVAAFGGVVRNVAAWTPGAFSRLQTAWEHDDAARMQAVVVGDTTTTDAKLGGALRFAGLRWSSDFAQQPEFSTYPGLDLRGAATVPTALDVYVNDALALHRDVGAGPYTLHDLPLFDGAGTVAIRAANAAGGFQASTVPYYVARELLKPGLVSFSYSAGFLDEGGTYGPFFVDASRRFGVSNSLTAGAMAQAGGGNLLAGADADWLAGRAGVFSLAAATSRNFAGTGTLWDAGYDYTGRRLSIGAEFKVASARFASLDPTALAIGREVDLHADLRLTRSASVQMSVVRDATVAGPVSLWTAGLAGSAGGTPFAITAYRTAGAAADAFGLTTTWTSPTGRRTTLSPHIGTGGNSAQSQLEYAGSAGSDASSLVWDATAGLTRDAASAARITAANHSGQLDVDATSAPGGFAYSTRFAGSIAEIGGSMAATRQVAGSYGLVRVPGFAGIDVYVNDRYAGKTDARGNLLTADLVPFVENEIRIDPARLAASAHVDALTRTVVPTAFGGTTIVFAAREETEVLVTLRGRDGRPLPPGTIVRAGAGERSWPIGLDGHADLIDVAPGPILLRAGDGARACTIRLVVPSTRAIAKLADARCEPLPDIRPAAPAAAH